LAVRPEPQAGEGRGDSLPEKAIWDRICASHPEVTGCKETGSPSMRLRAYLQQAVSRARKQLEE
jgi:hypothetical protein